MNHPRELLDKLEDSHDLSLFEDKIFTLMLLCLDRFKNKLPPSVRGELDIAKNYRLGLISSKELELSRQRVWMFIDKNKDKVGESKINLLRALIFTLYPRIEADSDAFEWIDCFIEFSNACTPMENYQYILIKEIFSEQLAEA